MSMVPHRDAWPATDRAAIRLEIPSAPTSPKMAASRIYLLKWQAHAAH
jgi:hypothetical protein